MRNNSLSFRLIFTSAVVAVVLLVSAAFLLAYLFQQALERNFDARLRAILDGLLANVELATDGSPVMSGRIPDPRFTLPLSGWYWQVSPPKQRTLADLASESSLEKRLVPTAADLQTRDAGGVHCTNRTTGISAQNNLPRLSGNHKTAESARSSRKLKPAFRLGSGDGTRPDSPVRLRTAEPEKSVDLESLEKFPPRGKARRR